MLTTGSGAARRKKVAAMDKPENPYRKGSIIWKVMEGDWEDLTVSQIAEVLDTPPQTISDNIRRIRVKTGYIVPRAGRKR